MCCDGFFRLGFAKAFGKLHPIFVCVYFIQVISYENFVAFILCYCVPFDFMQDQELALLKAAVFASMKEVSEICTLFSVTMIVV